MVNHDPFLIDRYLDDAMASGFAALAATADAACACLTVYQLYIEYCDIAISHLKLRDGRPMAPDAYSSRHLNWPALNWHSK